MATNSKPRTFGQFLKANVALLVIIACVLAISGIIIAESVSNSKPAKRLPVIEGNGIIKEIEVVIPDPIIPDPVIRTWKSPIAAGSYTVGMDFSLEEFAHCSTLNHWFIHQGVDLLTAEGTTVAAAFDGVVESITDTVLEGTTIVINHGGGLRSVYWSLADTVSVTVGQTVESGDAIGVASSSAYSEFADGAHVHFEMTLNGVHVNPRDYVEI